jgi:hypothetical protein
MHGTVTSDIAERVCAIINQPWPGKKARYCLGRQLESFRRGTGYYYLQRRTLADALI